MERLNLRNLWLTGPGLARLEAGLETKVRLRQLVAPYIATDRLLAALGRHCPLLEVGVQISRYVDSGNTCPQYLDITGAELVTDQGVPRLYRHTTGWQAGQPTELSNTLR